MKSLKCLFSVDCIDLTTVYYSDSECTCVCLLTRKRMPRDNLLWQAQLSPQRSHLIFMKIFQRFDYFSLDGNKNVFSIFTVYTYLWL